MLKRIHIQGYKSLKDVEVRLPSLCVLFGPNAAGKSNFLDALQLLSRIATSRTLEEAFRPPYRGKPLESFTFGDRGIKGLLEKDTASFRIEADLELSPVVVEQVNKQIREMRGRKPTDASSDREPSHESQISLVRETNLRYRIDVEIHPKSGILVVADEFLTALSSRGKIKRSRNAFLKQVEKRLHLRMERQSHPTYHDRCLDHSILSLPLYPPHYPHLVAVRQELASWLFFYFEPRERMRAPSPVKEVRHIGLMGEDLGAFLNTMHNRDQLQFRAVEKTLRQIIPSITGIEVGVNDLGEVEMRLLENGIPIPAGVISEGTLRILGLLSLAGAKDPPALLGFEEPENGIHPRRIQLVAEVLKSRASQDTQVIVTTHSPILLDMMPNESLIVCKKKIGKTSLEPFESSGAIFRKGEVRGALDEGNEEMSISQRMLRGDFDD